MDNQPVDQPAYELIIRPEPAEDKPRQWISFRTDADGNHVMVNEPRKDLDEILERMSKRMMARTKPSD